MALTREPQILSVRFTGSMRSLTIAGGSVPVRWDPSFVLCPRWRGLYAGVNGCSRRSSLWTMLMMAGGSVLRLWVPYFAPVHRASYEKDFLYNFRELLPVALGYDHS